MWLFVHVHITVHNFMLNFSTIGARLVELPSENFYLHEESLASMGEEGRDGSSVQ